MFYCYECVCLSVCLMCMYIANVVLFSSRVEVIRSAFPKCSLLVAAVIRAPRGPEWLLWTNDPRRPCQWCSVSSAMQWTVCNDGFSQMPTYCALLHRDSNSFRRWRRMWRWSRFLLDGRHLKHHQLLWAASWTRGAAEAPCDEEWIKCSNSFYQVVKKIKNLAMTDPTFFATLRKINKDQKRPHTVYTEMAKLSMRRVQRTQWTSCSRSHTQRHKVLVCRDRWSAWTRPPHKPLAMPW